jgi:RHS repeat-associated protein
VPHIGSPTTTTYVYGLGLISATDNAGATSYYLADGLGSTTQIVDSAGTLPAAESYSYDVWGNRTSATEPSMNDFRFTGQQNDHNANRGDYYLRAREYDPTLGRFLQRDPLTRNPGWVGSAYAYADANPSNYRDPSGLKPGPTPVPLPPAGSERARQKCEDAWELCHIFADQEWADWKRKHPQGRKPLQQNRDICNSFYDKCLNQMREGNPDPVFDMAGALQMMQDTVKTDVSPGFSLPSWWPTLPLLGTGGYLRGDGGKESQFGCLR